MRIDKNLLLVTGSIGNIVLRVKINLTTTGRVQYKWPCWWHIHASVLWQSTHPSACSDAQTANSSGPHPHAFFYNALWLHVTIPEVSRNSVGMLVWRLCVRIGKCGLG